MFDESTRSPRHETVWDVGARWGAGHTSWLLMLLALVLAVPSLAGAAQGQLDRRFALDGVARTALGASGLISVTGAAVQRDGRIVLVGPASGPKAVVVRFLSSGQPDLSFGGTGVALAHSLPDLAPGVAVAEERIVLAGVPSNGLSVARVFDQAGVAIGGHEISNFGAGAVGMTGDGVPLVLGLRARFGLISGYASGFTVSPTGVEEVVRTRELMESARIAIVNAAFLASGPTRIGILADTGLVRGQHHLFAFDGQGVVDSAFGNRGVVAVSNTAPLGALAVQPQGGIVVVDASSDHGQLRVRFLDAAGRSTSRLVDHPSDLTPVGLASAPDGRIVLVAKSGNASYVLIRLLPTGERDPSFGTNGIAEHLLGGFERTPSITVEPDGDILAYGTTIAGGTRELAVVRFIGSPCGDEVVDPGEQCDRGRGVNGTPGSCCTASCTRRPSGESCAAGGTCNEDGVCVGPLPPDCGNGTVETGEQCDDNRNPCCSATCGIEGPSKVCGLSTNPCVENSQCDGQGGCTPGQRLCSVSPPDVKNNGTRNVRVKVTCLAIAQGECRAEAREIVSGQGTSQASPRAEVTASVIAATPSRPLRCKRGRRGRSAGQLACKAKLVLRLTRDGRERLEHANAATILQTTVQPDGKPEVPVKSPIEFLKFLRSRR